MFLKRSCSCNKKITDKPLMRSEVCFSQLEIEKIFDNPKYIYTPGKSLESTEKAGINKRREARASSRRVEEKALQRANRIQVKKLNKEEA